MCRASPLPSHGIQSPCEWLTLLAVSVAPQLPTALLLSPNHQCSLAQRTTRTRDTFPISLTAQSTPVYILGGSGIHLSQPISSLSAQLTPQRPFYGSPCFTPAFIQPNPSWHNSCPPEKVPNSIRRGLEDLALPASHLFPYSSLWPSLVPQHLTCPLPFWSCFFASLSDLLPDTQLSKGQACVCPIRC